MSRRGGIVVYLFGYDDDFGTFDSVLDVLWSESVEVFWWVQITSSSACDDIQADDECRV